MGLPPYLGQPCWRCNSERLSFRYENYNGDNRSQASMYLCWSCLDCGTESIGVIYDPDPCNVACGWAFDAGVREAERDRAKETARLGFFLHDVLGKESADDVSAAVAAERERCAKVESELRAALGKREDEWTAMHDAVRRCFWEGLSRDGRLIPSEQLTKRLIEARDLLHKIDGAPAPRE